MNGFPTHFTSITPALRLHAGQNALQHLPRELDRTGAQRAFIVCGRSVATRTPLLARVRTLLEHRHVGAYTALRKDAPLEDVLAATAAARKIHADALIAIGSGSVLKATRVIAILLAEVGTPETLATQYLPGMSPISPKLLVPKPPIFNILTAATSAQHRAGSALKSATGGPRLEFFDPKTRPAALFWDADALLTAPPALALSTGLSVCWRALMNMGALHDTNPLVQASRLHAWTLACDALPNIRVVNNAAARIQMCAAALLQNRDEDDGGRPFDAHWIARVIYALSAALFNQLPHLDQGTTHALLTAPTLQHFGDLCPEHASAIVTALGIQLEEPWHCTAAVTTDIQQWFARFGVPMRLRDLHVSPSVFPTVIDHAMQNFNADRHQELRAHRTRLEAVLRAAY